MSFHALNSQYQRVSWVKCCLSECFAKLISSASALNTSDYEDEMSQYSWKNTIVAEWQRFFFLQVQGMSFIAAVLILNLDTADAFIAFSNLLNKPCQMAFFRVDHGLVSI